MPVRASSGYKPAPHEDMPVKCPTCGQPGFIHAVDERGVLMVHPGRRFCRVAAGTEVGA